MRTRVKICGVTRPEDAELACALGADAIGFVCVPRSARCLPLAGARGLRDVVAGLVPLVALFADPAVDTVEEVLETVRPDLLQFHGSEPESFCERFRWPYLKALSHRDFAVGRTGYRSARALIVDSHAPGALGGSGRSFDWLELPGDIERSWLLAGGLSPDNVAAAIRIARPYGVDVASGVEAAPGVKDVARLERFFEEVARVDSDAQPAPA